MATQIVISSALLNDGLDKIKILVAKHGQVVVSVESAFIGKWGMARLWRSWMSSTAQYMAMRGAVMPLLVKPNGDWYGERQYNKNDAHECFTFHWLGADANGNRYSWAKQSHDGLVAAPKGHRFMAMMRHQEYMIERGIKYMNPRASEFQKLMLKSEGQL
ncbi:MAG: hypothetical protein HRU25_07980 [Psychrobium sp.]|nr:hypothetical protein [Psychrobium sp.]